MKNSTALFLIAITALQLTACNIGISLSTDEFAPPSPSSRSQEGEEKTASFYCREEVCIEHHYTTCFEDSHCSKNSTCVGGLCNSTPNAPCKATWDKEREKVDFTGSCFNNMRLQSLQGWPAENVFTADRTGELKKTTDGYSIQYKVAISCFKPLTPSGEPIPLHDLGLTNVAPVEYVNFGWWLCPGIKINP